MSDIGRQFRLHFQSLQSLSYINTHLKTWEYSQEFPAIPSFLFSSYKHTNNIYKYMIILGNAVCSSRHTSYKHLQTCLSNDCSVPKRGAQVSFHFLVVGQA